MLYPTTGTYVTAQAIGTTANMAGVSKENFLYVYIQGVVTSASSLNTAIKLQASSDNTSFTDVSGQSQTITTNGTYAWSISASAAKYWRLVNTNTAGTGSLTVTFNMM